MADRLNAATKYATTHRSECRQTALSSFGIAVSTAQDARRFRIEGLRVWECRDRCWFIHSYRQVPEQLVRLATRSDGREVPIFRSAHLERTATKQASKKEIRDAQPLLRRDRLAPTGSKTRTKSAQHDSRR